MVVGVHLEIGEIDAGDAAHCGDNGVNLCGVSSLGKIRHAFNQSSHPKCVPRVSPHHHRRFWASRANCSPGEVLLLSGILLQDYFGGLIKGLGGGYLLSPAGGIARKSLLTRGSAGGVYFCDGRDANGFLSIFLGAGVPFMYCTSCLAKKITPTTHRPITAASSQRRPKAARTIVTTAKRIPNKE